MRARPACSPVSALIEVVEDAIGRNKLQPYVCDPVMVAKSGDELLKKDAIAAMRKRLFPLAAVVTPNRREAAILAGADPKLEFTIAPGEGRGAAHHRARAPRPSSIKGIAAGDQTVDLFFDGREFLEFAAKTHPKEKTHGSGCAFSAAITAGLANGKTLVDAIDQAKKLVTMAIQYSDGQGRGTSPVNVLAFAKEEVATHRKKMPKTLPPGGMAGAGSSITPLRRSRCRKAAPRQSRR